jgi:ubiquinone/menaquinone biosynthesis C-methylase UbiE
MTVNSGFEEYAFIADLYDHVPLYRDRSDVKFFVEAARATGDPILEIGCGTGRVLIPVARAGVHILGLTCEALSSRTGSLW